MIALLLSRVAAGFGGFMAGTGLVHAIVAENKWGIVIAAAGVVLLLYGVRQAARLSTGRSHPSRR